MKRGEILKKKDIIMKRPGLGLNGQKINMIIDMILNQMNMGSIIKARLNYLVPADLNL